MALIIIALTGFGCLYNQLRLSSSQSNPDNSSNATGARQYNKGELDMIISEMNILRSRIDNLNTEDSATLESLRIESAELNHRLVEISAASSYRDALTEINSQFVSQGLTLATAWITFVSLIVAIVGILSFLKHKNVKEELTQAQTVMRNLSTEVERKISTFNFATRSLESSVTKTRALAEASVERFFSDGILEFLRAFQQDGIISEVTDEKLRIKTKEAEARILLFFPNWDRVKQAVRTLAGLGTRSSIADLSVVGIQDDTPQDVRELIHMAIAKISERDPPRPPDREAKDAGTVMTPRNPEDTDRLHR